MRSYVYVHVYVKTQRTCSHLHGGHKEEELMELVHRGFFFCLTKLTLRYQAW